MTQNVPPAEFKSVSLSPPSIGPATNLAKRVDQYEFQHGLKAQPKQHMLHGYCAPKAQTTWEAHGFDSWCHLKAGYGGKHLWS